MPENNTIHEIIGRVPQYVLPDRIVRASSTLTLASTTKYLASRGDDGAVRASSTNILTSTIKYKSSNKR